MKRMKMIEVGGQEGRSRQFLKESDSKKPL
jgi:hypothetical protein